MSDALLKNELRNSVSLGSHFFKGSSDIFGLIVRMYTDLIGTAAGFVVNMPATDTPPTEAAPRSAFPKLPS